MRYLLMCSAVVLVVLIGLPFLEEPEHTPPFEGKRVIVLASGRGGEGFRQAVEQGAVRAYKDLGCSINISNMGWESSEVRTRLQQVMASAPDGICIIGDPDNTELLPLFDDAIEGGIIITSYQREMPEAYERYNASGYGFAGPDFYRAGEDLINAAVKKHNILPGSLVLLVHDPRERDDLGLYGGAVAAIQSHGLQFEPVEAGRGHHESVDEALRPKLKNRDGSGPDPALVCSVNSSLEFTLRTLRDSGIGPEKLPLVGLGSAYEVTRVQDMIGTHLSILLDQDLPLQAYLSILQACMAREYGAVGTRIHTPHNLIDFDSLAQAKENASTNFIQRF